MSSMRPGQMLRIVFSLGWADFTVKYHGSLLGYLWSLMVPIMKFLVIEEVFRHFFPQTIPHYPLYLFLGIILWEYFSLTTTACASVPFTKADIIRKIRLPRLLLVFAAAWTQFLVFLTYFVIFLAALLWSDLPWHWGELLFLVLFLDVAAVAVGTGLFLAAYILRFRDIPHLWTVLLQIIFWLTPVAYPFVPAAPVLETVQSIIGGHFSLNVLVPLIIRLQPLSVLLQDARRIFLYSEAGLPTAPHLIGLTVFCLFLLLCGIVVFQKRSVHFLDEY